MTAKAIVIGGNSRVAHALRKLYPREFHYLRRAQIVTPQGQTASERFVSSYAEVTARDLEGYSAVITLVGTTHGSPGALQAVNANLPQHFAIEAAQAGVPRFVALSSFSVYGNASRIDAETPTHPHTNYGRSRLDGEKRIAKLADRMHCTIARCPILYGAGDSKLEKLISLWCKCGMMPAPEAPINRSMVHYDLAAQYLHDVVSLESSCNGLTIANFSDPIPFEYYRVSQILSSVTAWRKRIIRVPAIGLRLLNSIFPGMCQSLYKDNFLLPENNYFCDIAHTRLDQDIARMASNKGNEV